MSLKPERPVSASGFEIGRMAEEFSNGDWWVYLGRIDLTEFRNHFALLIGDKNIDFRCSLRKSNLSLRQDRFPESLYEAPVLVRKRAWQKTVLEFLGFKRPPGWDEYMARCNMLLQKTHSDKVMSGPFGQDVFAIAKLIYEIVSGLTLSDAEYYDFFSGFDVEKGPVSPSRETTSRKVHGVLGPNPTIVLPQNPTLVLDSNPTIVPSPRSGTATVHLPPSRKRPL